jgi:X-X-X-Leu-X-X-Gly heptad repeat protein
VMDDGGVSSTTATVGINDLNGGVDQLVSNLECVLTFFPKDSAGSS